MKLIDGTMTCVPDNPRSRVSKSVGGTKADASMTDAREAAYAAYDAEIQNSWRHAK
jgi:hypothetical protein